VLSFTVAVRSLFFSLRGPSAAPAPAVSEGPFVALGGFIVRGDGTRGVRLLGLAGRRVPAEGEVVLPRRDVDAVVDEVSPLLLLLPLALVYLAGDITRPRLGEEEEALEDLSSAINLLAAASSIASSSLRATLRFEGTRNKEASHRHHPYFTTPISRSLAAYFYFMKKKVNVSIAHLFLEAYVLALDVFFHFVQPFRFFLGVFVQGRDFAPQRRHHFAFTARTTTTTTTTVVATAVATTTVVVVVAASLRAWRAVHGAQTQKLPPQSVDFVAQTLHQTVVCAAAAVAFSFE